MKRLSRLTAPLLLIVCLLAPLPLAAQEPAPFALKSIVPPEAQMAAVWRQNPERELQREHLAEVIETFQKERIGERVMEIIRNRLDQDDLEEAEAGWEKFRQATASASVEALLNASEVAFFQVTEGQAANNVVAVRMTPDAVQGYLDAARALIKLAEEESGDQFTVTDEQIDGVSCVSLSFAGAPIQPTIAGQDDVLLLSTTQPLALAAAARLGGGTIESKFDQPRLKQAFAKLPAAEDSIYFYDGKQHIRSLRDQLEPAMEAIRVQADGDPRALAVANLIEAMIEEIAVTDYEVAVGYTQDGHLRTSTLGAMMPGTDDRLLRLLVKGGEPFEEWSRWTPAGAGAFRLSSGVDLHAVYQRALEIFSREAPEIAAEALVKLAELEEQINLSIEDDLLSLFSGESVSVTLDDGQSFFACKCRQPERTKELLHRLVDTLREIPQVAAQQVEFAPCDDLDGFEELRAAIFGAVAVRPVIGFQEGWMVVGTTPDAARAALDVRWGDGESFASTEAFSQFDLPVDGPVSAISYSNTAAGVRKAAMYINQAAAMAPLFLGAALQEADPKDAEAAQKALALLPSIARVIEKLDFLEAQLAVQRPGDSPDVYRKESVQLIRQD